MFISSTSIIDTKKEKRDDKKATKLKPERITVKIIAKNS